MKLKSIIYKIAVVIVTIGLNYYLFIPILKRAVSHGKLEKKLDELIKKNTFIEKQIVVGMTTRREFEVLFNAHPASGISNQDYCKRSLYSQADILLELEFDDDSFPGALELCDPNATISKPIVFKRTH